MDNIPQQAGGVIAAEAGGMELRRKQMSENEAGIQSTEGGRIWDYCLAFLREVHSTDKVGDGADPPSVINTALAQAHREGRRAGIETMLDAIIKDWSLPVGVEWFEKIANRLLEAEK